MMKKKVILSSILTIALCLCLIAGSTFALFTSETKTDVAITAATVKLTATIENLEYDSVLVGGKLDQSNAVANGNVIDVQYMVPGDYFTFDIVIDNESNVQVDYKALLSLVEDGGLWGGLVVSYEVYTANGQIQNLDPTAYAALDPNEDVTVHVTVSFPQDRGNGYQETGCRFAVNVEAIQGNAQ